jgi:hypothetical protein
MMFADDTAEGAERTNDMLRRRGYTQDEIDQMYDED